MEIKKEIKEETLNVVVSGRLDTNTAPELESAVTDDIVGIKDLNFDFEKLDYISSAGLRVILKFHKQMTSVGGTLTIFHPTDEVLEVFDMTGFSTFLTIKE